MTHTEWAKDELYSWREKQRGDKSQIDFGVEIIKSNKTFTYREIGGIKNYVN